MTFSIRTSITAVEPILKEDPPIVELLSVVTGLCRMIAITENQQVDSLHSTTDSNVLNARQMPSRSRRCSGNSCKCPVGALATIQIPIVPRSYPTIMFTSIQRGVLNSISNIGKTTGQANYRLYHLPNSVSYSCLRWWLT